MKRPNTLLDELAGVTAQVMVCGHSHMPRVVELPDGPLLVNVGSVGLPAYADELPIPHKMESGTPHAKYAVLEVTTGTWHAEIIQVDYDWRAAAELALAQGRPDWARWLTSGLA